MGMYKRKLTILEKYAVVGEAEMFVKPFESRKFNLQLSENCGNPHDTLKAEAEKSSRKPAFMCTVNF